MAADPDAPPPGDGATPGEGKPKAALVELLQGDLIAGVALAVTGVGVGAYEDLPAELREGRPLPPGGLGDWSVTLATPSGWAMLLSQDCDLVRADDDEPTVEVAMVRTVDQAEAAKYRASRYHSRYHILPPGALPGLAGGQRALVDLAWRTSVLKVSLDEADVRVHRPLTEPQRREVGRWLGWRSGRAAFPDDVVRTVLDPFDDLVRARAGSADNKPPGNRNDVQQVVTAVTAWYVSIHEDEVNLYGVISAQSLTAAGYDDAAVAATTAFDEHGNPRSPTGPVQAGRAKLQTELAKKLARDYPSGYRTTISLIDLDQVSAADFVRMRLLVR